MTTLNAIAKKSKDQIKERAKESIDKVNEITHDVKTVFLRDPIKEPQDYMKTLFATIMSIINQFVNLVQKTLYPQLLIIYKKYVNGSTVSSNDSKTSNESSFASPNLILQSVDDSKIKQFLQYVPLILELYFVMFHVFAVRVWILINFACTVLYMYDNLTESAIDQRVIPVGINELKKLAIFVIGSGLVMMIFFTKTLGFFTLPLMIYLMNRTTKNIFNKGF